MRVLELITLGRVSLTDADGAPVATLLAQPKRLGMLVYLAVAGAHGVVRRDVLCEMFWPDAPTERARASLRQALAFLRRSLGDEAIVTRGDDEIGVNAQCVRCDATLLRMHLMTRGADRARSVELYTGEFMPGFAVDEVPLFDRWLEDVRSAITRDVGEAALQLAQDALTRGDAHVVTLAQRACAITPLDERALVVLMEALDASGDRAGALRSYEGFVRRLAETLDIEPAPETVSVAQAIRAREAARGMSPTAPQGSPSPSARASSKPSSRAPTPTSGHAPPPRLGDASSPASELTSSPTSAPAAPASQPAWRWVAVVTAVAAVAAGLMLYPWMRARDAGDVAKSTIRGPVSGDRVLVVPFSNETGDPALDALGRMAADWITEGFSRVDGLAVVPGTTLLAMDRARRAGDSAVPVQLDAMARETGATMVVSGSYYRTGGTLHLQARLTDASLSTLLRPVETVSVPIDSVEQGVATIRERVLASVAPLMDSTTHFRFANTPPSYEAYGDFLRGFEQFVDGDLTNALASFERAAQADTTYRMAQLAAAIAQSNMGDFRGAFARVRDLKQSRERFGPVEQGTLDMIDGMLRGDIPAVYAAVARTSRITPGSIVEYMVAESARRLNRPKEALRVLRGLHPDRGELRGWRAYWREMGYALHMTGDYDGELSMAREVRVRYPDSGDLLAAQVRAMAALGYVDSLHALLSSVDVGPGALRSRVGAMYRLAAEELLLRGDSVGATRLAQRAVTWYEAAPNRSRLAGYVRALRLAGRSADAWRVVVALGDTITANTSSLGDLGISVEQDTRVLMRDAGVLAAVRGDTATAMRWELRIAQQQATLDEALRGGEWAGLQLDRAAIASQLGDVDRAISLLREAFDRGLAYWPGLMSDMDLAPLRNHPAWRAMMTPAG